MKKVDALEKNTCLRMEVNAVRSQFLFPAAVWSCVHPTCPSEPLDSCWEYIFPYVHIQVVYCNSSDLDHGEGSAYRAELKWLGFGQTSQTRADSGNFSALVFFQVWDTIFCPCFWKISASNHAFCVIPWAQHWKGHAKDNILSTWHYLRDRFV